jgi:plastocyanin
MLKFMSLSRYMTTQLTEKSLILFLALNLSLGSLGYLSIYPDGFVTAISSVTIETVDDTVSDDDESKSDGFDEADQSEEEIGNDQDSRSIQPSPKIEQIRQNSNHDDSGNSYEVVIPDSAAWKESLSERFKPSEIVVPVGSEVTWINHDDTTHAIASGKQLGQGGVYNPVHDGIFYSGNMEEGESFSFQFDESGRFDYYCIPHPWMTGAVVVQ